MLTVLETEADSPIKILKCQNVAKGLDPTACGISFQIQRHPHAPQPDREIR